MLALVEDKGVLVDLRFVYVLGHGIDIELVLRQVHADSENPVIALV